jgi:tetratricopeptide (TPR) repeat protein
MIVNMSKRRLVLLISVMAIGVLAWQLPAILKSIPSRYVAAYLPEPIQALAERDHVDLLPTAAVKTNAVSRFNPDPSPTFEAIISNAPSAIETGMDDRGGDLAGDESGQNEVDKLQNGSEPSSTPSPVPTELPLIPSSSRLVPFKHQFQTWNNCGPATLAMGLSFFGLDLDQELTAATLKPNPEDRNVSPGEMAAYVNNETELSAISRVNGDLYALKRFVANGYPVIVELGLDPPGEYRWMGWYGHYLLVVAYDDASEQFWVYDSWFGTSEVPVENADTDGRQVRYSDLDDYWRQFNRSYTVLYHPEHEPDIEEIIGSDIDDNAMWLRALTTVQKELDADLDNAFLWFNLGSIYSELANYENSVAAFDQARAIGLPWRMLWYQFGPYKAYYHIGRYDDVILLADVTLLDRPYFEESYYYKGLALKAMGRDQEAITNLELAIRFNPNFEPAALLFDQLGTSD